MKRVFRMSALGHKRTFAMQKVISDPNSGHVRCTTDVPKCQKRTCSDLFDHLVGERRYAEGKEERLPQLAAELFKSV
jgi:hypothetical protein